MVARRPARQQAAVLRQIKNGNRMATAPPGSPSPLGAQGSVAGGSSHSIAETFDQLERDFVVVQSSPPAETLAISGGTFVTPGATGSLPVLAHLPAAPPGFLGDRSFRDDYEVSLAYVAGAMANGIASVELVTALARARILSFFGAAGLTIEEVARALDRLAPLGELPYGVNLIHAPGEPRVERDLVDLVLARGVRAAEASAFLELTPAIVKFRVTGVRRGPDGVPIPARRLMAKVSRREVARRFLSPPPTEILDALLRDRAITADEHTLARHLPMCDDLTAEADSGGHTDNRPLVTLLPSLIALRDEISQREGYPRAPRVGAAGGIGTPWAAHAAFSLGAAYVVVGSVHQSCLEAGTSDAVRRLLAVSESTDVAMAPAADMFEMGVELQVLRRGTMFSMRARQLYELYRRYPSWEQIPAADQSKVEKTHFRDSFDAVWEHTRTFFLARDPDQVARADSDPKHKLALVFRWYLGLSSAWANRGDPERTLDYQIWCGPAMGAFNEWVRGSAFEAPENRRVVDVATALMDGAARVSRADLLRRAGLALPSGVPDLRPRPNPIDSPAPARTHS